MLAVWEPDLDLKPELAVEVRVPVFEKLVDVALRAPPFSVEPVRWIGVGRPPVFVGSTGFG